jgi:hypothetical protein
MENLQVKLQIIGEDNRVLASSTVKSDTIKAVKELHGVDLLVDIYNSLLENLEENKNGDL